MCSNFSSADASPWIIIQCRVYKLRKYPYGTKSYYSWDDYCSTPTVLVWLTSWRLPQLIHESLSKENKLGERLLSHFSSIFSLFRMDTIDPTVRTFWRGAYRHCALIGWNEAHKSWPGNRHREGGGGCEGGHKCVQPSLIHQLSQFK